MTASLAVPGWRAVLASIVATLLISCATSPPVRYFQLGYAETEVGDSQSSDVAVGLGPLRLADYLKRTKMVRRGAGNEIIVDEYSRWAEPLDDAIARVLAAQLYRELPVVALPASSASGSFDLRYRVLGSIERFDAAADGQVVLVAQWAVVDSESEFPGHPIRRTYALKTPDPGDPQEVARTMSDVLALFGNDIVKELGGQLARED